jgi:hypothetical protein
MPHVLKVIHTPHNLVKERDEALRVRLGTVPAVEAARVRHVALVVGRVEVHAIPARWQVELGPQTVGAVLLR